MTKSKLRRAQPPPDKHDWRYRKLFELVDSALFETFKAHPDYLTEHGRQKASGSIAKRIVGSLMNLIKRAERQ